MKFKKLSMALVVSLLISVLGSVCVSADSASPQTLNLSQLTSYSTSNQVNVMLYDSNGLIESEFHSNGERVDYQVDKQTGKVQQFKNSNGIKTVLHPNSDGSLNISMYDAKNNLISSVTQNKIDASLTSSTPETINARNALLSEASQGLINSDFSQIISQNSSNPMTSTSDYYDGGYNMSNMLPSLWTVSSNDRFARPSTAMTQTDIQNFLVSKNSILQYSVQVWQENSNKTVSNTGRVVTPSVIINEASVNSVVNPKIIIATIQKEQGLITATTGDPMSRSFYFCMGYGATDGGDIYSDTGFDTQVTGGTSLLANLWYQSYNLGQSGFPLQFLDKDGISLRIDNCGTYALYQYTPWVSSNLSFLQVMHGFWPGSDQNNINWN